jgi:hypothetical protein
VSVKGPRCILATLKVICVHRASVGMVREDAFDCDFKSLVDSLVSTRAYLSAVDPLRADTYDF